MTITLLESASDRKPKPVTMEDWLPWVGERVMCKLKAGAGTAWTPGHQLLAVRKDAAQIRPAKHNNSLWVSLDRIKPWLSATHNLQRLKDLRATDTRVMTEAAPDLDRWVIRERATGKFFGGSRLGKWGFSHGPETCSTYASKEAAYTIKKRYFQGASPVYGSCEFMTKGRALGDLQRVAKAVESAKAADLATKILDKALGRKDTEPEVLAPPPMPTPAPKAEPLKESLSAAPLTAAPACEQCFQDWGSLMKDESEAEAMMLEIRAKRVRAEGRLRVDSERRRLGLGATNP